MGLGCDPSLMQSSKLSVNNKIESWNRPKEWSAASEMADRPTIQTRDHLTKHSLGSAVDETQSEHMTHDASDVFISSDRNYGIVQTNRECAAYWDRLK